MNQITNILYWLSTGLLIPVTVFLIFFFIRALMLIGSFYGIYLSRNKINSDLNRKINNGEMLEIFDSIMQFDTKEALIIQHLHRIKTHRRNPLMLNKILGDYEIASDKELGKSKLLVKIGPMLGLMGTLIPMGPALVGLATGDVASMANNMQVAFATTVVGIIIGAIGFITLQVRNRWAADDMNILEYIVESIVESIKRESDDKEA